MSDHRPVIASAKLIAGCTLTSRVTGLVRDMLLVHSFGAGWVLDSFFYAFQIPNLFRRLFGEGALAAVFVPTFTRTLEKDGRPAAWKLLARTLALLTVTIIAVVLAIETIVLLIWLFHPGEESRQLILGLTALTLPFMLSICVVALLSSILNCVGSFVPAASTPIILNLVMIAALIVFRPTIDPAQGIDDSATQVFGIAASVLVAGVLQLVFLFPVLRANRVPLGWSFQPRDPLVREISQKMIPVLFGQGILLLGTFLDAQVCALLSRVQDGPESTSLLGFTFAYPLQEGALSAITVAQRLYQFPLGVLGISLAVAALPTFSRLAANQNWGGWKTEVTRSLRLAVFVGLLTGAMMIALAEPIVQLLFEYREFGAADTARAARVLRLYGFGMWAFCAQHITLRGFYSIGDVRTPVRISCVLVPINLALSLILIWFDAIREAAFAISTSVTSTAAVIIGIILLQRRSGTHIGIGKTLAVSVRMLVIAVVSALLVWWLRQQWLPHLANAIDATAVRRGVDTLGALTLGCAMFLALGTVLGLPESRLLLRHRRRS
jgi:putative peptidoglycan lipid II flippase